MTSVHFTDVEVARVDEIPAGGRKFLTFGDITIGLFNVSGEFYAIENVCPHQGGPVCEGDMFRHLDAEVTADGKIRRFYRSEEHNIVACPWHGYEFDVKTGRCLVNPDYSTQPYPVHISGDAVFISIPNMAASTSAST